MKWTQTTHTHRPNKGRWGIGIHRDELIRDLPTDYLEWARQARIPRWGQMAHIELAKRARAREHTHDATHRIVEQTVQKGPHTRQLYCETCGKHIKWLK